MLSRMTNGTGFGFGHAFGGATDPILRLHGEMNRVFESFFEDVPAPATRPYARGWPALNTWEDGDAAWVEAELPGAGGGRGDVPHRTARRPPRS